MNNSSHPTPSETLPLPFISSNMLRIHPTHKRRGNLFIDVPIAWRLTLGFLAPSGEGAQAAAHVSQIPKDLRFYITNSPNRDAYPISGFSWVMVYKHQPDTDKGITLANLLWWMIHDGQLYARPLVYVPLADAIVARGEAQIKTMTCGSANVLCFLRAPSDITSR